MINMLDLYVRYFVAGIAMAMCCTIIGTMLYCGVGISRIVFGVN